MSLTLSTTLPKVDCRKRTNIKGMRTPIPIITLGKNRLILSKKAQFEPRKCTAIPSLEPPKTNNRAKDSSIKGKPSQREGASLIYRTRK